MTACLFLAIMLIMTDQKMLPAEWQDQSGILLTWPHKQTDFASELTEVERVFCELAIAISQYEHVVICSNDEAHTSHIMNLLMQTSCKLENIKLYPVPSNDSWARDHGPITILKNDKPVLLDFKFNGWGDRYPYNLDNAITAILSQQGAFNSELTLNSINYILEGGSIESDGQGTILTTSQCLLSASRNHNYKKTDVETVLKDLLGAERVLWLEHGQLLGDDTDSHIDMLARFINADTLCYMTCKNKSDPHYDWLNNMKAELEAFKTTNGNAYQLIELPLPNAILNPLGQRLPASYCNFLITNKAVLVPIYDCLQDESAIKILTECFPTHEIVPINCRALIEQHGSLHCVTMQLPMGVLVD